MIGQPIWKRIFQGIVFLIVLMAAPLLGVKVAGGSPLPYLQFPLLTEDAAPKSFSWILFVSLLFLIALALWPFVKRLAGRRFLPRKSDMDRKFPPWGWAALSGCILFWVLAWSRFAFFEPFQRFTFFPLWFCLIVTLNAAAYRLSGRSLMTDRSLYFTLLFPASSAFWWLFEYLNRFVNNWYYTGLAEIGGLQYFLEASLSFSTVLPAVMSMRFLLLQMPAFSEGYDDFPGFHWLRSNTLWGFLGVISAGGLVALGWKPDFFYPLLWIAPGLLWIAFQKWMGYNDPMLEKAFNGEFTLLWSSAVAALFCGIFWEMWNFYSEAKWIYNIPGVARFHLFEMPLLGYTGYLPFGILCALVSNYILNLLHPSSSVNEEKFEG